MSLALKVTPRLLGRVDDASKREGVGRTEWIRRYQRGEEPAGASISRHVFLLWLLKRFAGSAEGRYADLHRAAYDFNDLQVRDRFGEALGDQRGERRDVHYLARYVERKRAAWEAAGWHTPEFRRLQAARGRIGGRIGGRISRGGGRSRVYATDAERQRAYRGETGSRRAGGTTPPEPECSNLDAGGARA